MIIILKKGYILFKIFIISFSFSIALFTFSGCDTASTDSEPTETVAAASQYQLLVEESLSYRVKALRLFEELEDREVLTGADLDALHHLTLNQLSLKDEIAAFIEENQDLITDAQGYSEKERIQLVMISLSALLLRYDNYLIAYINYENNTKLRQLLNDEDSAYDIPANTLSDMTNTYNNITHREDVKDMIVISCYRTKVFYIKHSLLNHSKSCSYLQNTTI